MKKIFKAKNIHCSSCSNLIKGSLEDEFGEITVNLEANPKEVTVEISDAQSEAKFKEEMSDIGFDILED